MGLYKKFLKYFTRPRKGARAPARRDLDKAQAYLYKQLKEASRRALRLFAGVILLTFISLYAGAKAPQLHGDYLLATVGSNVVRITTVDNFYRGGTAFAVDWGDGTNRVVSNAHICAIADERGYMALHLPLPKNTIVIAKIIRVDRKKDLCLLTEAPGLSGLELASEAPRLNQSVASLGHPFLRPLTLSKGRILGRSETFIAPRIYNSYISDVATYPGNSGSPVVDFWGNVVAVVFAGQIRSKYGIFIQYRDLKAFLDL